MILQFLICRVPQVGPIHHGLEMHPRPVSRLDPAKLLQLRPLIASAPFCHSRKKQESQRSLKLISSDDEFSGEVDEVSLRTKVMTVGWPREQRP